MIGLLIVFSLLSFWAWNHFGNRKGNWERAAHNLFIIVLFMSFCIFLVTR